MWLLLFNCDSKLGVAKPEIPVLALREPESDILAAWQLISSLFSEILLEIILQPNSCGLENNSAYMLCFGSMVQKWCETLLSLFFFFLQ